MLSPGAFMGPVVRRESLRPDFALVRLVRPQGVCIVAGCQCEGTSVELEWFSTASLGESPSVVMWAGYCDEHEGTALQHFEAVLERLDG
jgi:hypothetical protein